MDAAQTKAGGWSALARCFGEPGWFPPEGRNDTSGSRLPLCAQHRASVPRKAGQGSLKINKCLRQEVGGPRQTKQDPVKIRAN